MQINRFKSAQAVLVILAMTSLASAANFIATCPSFKLEGTFLSGYCRSRDGFFRNSRINLNRIITNTNGLLNWRANGNYGNSCEGCKLQTSSRRMMGCFCKNFGGNLVYTQIDLNERIDNTDGILQF
jgi:hypothetical protein